MDTFIKNRIVNLEKEIDVLEMRMLKVFGSGSTRTYNNLKNEQHRKSNELKNLRLRFTEDNLLQK